MHHMQMLCATTATSSLLLRLKLLSEHGGIEKSSGEIDGPESNAFRTVHLTVVSQQCCMLDGK